MRPSLIALGALLSSFGVAAPWMAAPQAGTPAPGAARAAFFPPAPAEYSSLANPARPESLAMPLHGTAETPAFEPVADRMLVFGGEGYRVGEEAAPEYSSYGQLPGQPEEIAGMPVWHTTFEGPWREGRGVRYRILYKNARGVTWRAGNYFHLHDPQRGNMRMHAGSLPLADKYAVYNVGDRVWAVVEVENTGDKPLGEVVVAGMQEAYEPAGREGRAIPDTGFSYKIPRIMPGETRAADFVFPMVAHEPDRPISFQQTHLRVFEGGRVLADMPQAAVVDPPNWDLR